MEVDRTNPALRLRAVAKEHRGGLFARRRRALDSVDLELEPGRWLGLVGPNGSGKSTLLRIAAGISAPTRGQAAVFGVDPRVATVRGRLGYVPEGSPFPEELSPAAALSLCASLQGLDGRERGRRCAAMLDRVGLGDVRQRLSRCSQGMRRRLALAQAFVHEPELLLLDEPGSGLDAEGHAVFAELLDEARGRGAALLLASHDPRESVGVVDDTVLLRRGRLETGWRAALAPDGRIELTVEGLGPEALEELERFAVANGGRVLGRHPALSAVLAASDEGREA